MSKEYIDSNQNNQFSQLRGMDLQELIVQIQNYLLEYRVSLNLPKDTKFGIGIGFSKINPEVVQSELKKKGLDWTIETAAYLSKERIIFSRILNDTPKSWEEIQTISEYLNKKRAKPHPYHGCIIQVDTGILGKDIDAWRRFCKLYTIYEDILFRFGYGEKINARKTILKDAQPLADFLYEDLGVINSKTEVLSLIYPLQSYHIENAINFKSINFYSDSFKAYYEDFYEELANVINFKSPNCTTDPIIIQNYINAYTKLVMAASKETIDEDLLDFKLQTDRSSYKNQPYDYDLIKLQKALEFVDLVFDNNLDKIYFLRQYFKDFMETYQREISIKSKNFVRTLQPKKPTSQ